MTREEAINQLQDAKDGYKEYLSNEALDMAIKALEQEPVIDKIDEIITDALDKSTDKKESQTLRWVLDKISEVI